MSRRLSHICVFCGSQPGKDARYAAAARAFGGLLAARGIALVFGGGRVGMMGAVAEAVLVAGGRVVGVIPEGLIRRELAYEGLSELIVTDTMHERKQRMAELSDGFVSLPGGFGTFEEFCEIVTWAQLGMHEKPCALFNVLGYYEPLLRMFDHALVEGFLRPEHRSLVLVEDEPGRLLERMTDWQAPPLKKWLSRDAS